MAFLQMQFREGHLYKIDARLRPSGNQGTLVVSQTAFRGHHQHHAHQQDTGKQNQTVLRVTREVSDPPHQRRADHAANIADRVDQGQTSGSFPALRTPKV